MPQADTAHGYILLGDVVGSREIRHRSSFEGTLATALEEVNRLYAESLRTPLERLKGIDELGGQVADLACLPELLADILDRVHPVIIRFVVAYGAIDVGAWSETCRSMDGPAFHRAADLMDQTHDHGLEFDIGTGLDARGAPVMTAVDHLVASTMNLLLMGRAHLTARQIEIIRAYKHHGTQERAARELNIPQQAISQALTRASYQRHEQLKERICSALGQLYA